MTWTKPLVRFVWRYGIVIVCAILIVVTALLSVRIRDYDQGIGITSPLGDFKFTASLGFYHYRYFHNPREWGIARIYGNAFQSPEFNAEQRSSWTPRFYISDHPTLYGNGITIQYRHAMVLLGMIAIGSLLWIFLEKSPPRFARMTGRQVSGYFRLYEQCERFRRRWGRRDR